MIGDFLLRLADFTVNFISDAGYFGVWLLMLIDAVNFPVPSEIILGFTGFLVTEGRFNFWLAALLAGLGSTSGAILSYWLGLVGGRPFVKRFGRWFLIGQKDLDNADRLFKKYGVAFIFFSRFIPLLRTLISLPAGITHMPFWPFTLFTFLGSFLWAVILIYIGTLVGENYQQIADSFEGAEYVVLAVLVAGIVYWVYRQIKEQFGINRDKKAEKERKQSGGKTTKK